MCRALHRWHNIAWLFDLAVSFPFLSIPSVAFTRGIISGSYPTCPIQSNVCSAPRHQLKVRPVPAGVLHITDKISGENESAHNQLELENVSFTCALSPFVGQQQDRLSRIKVLLGKAAVISLDTEPALTPR
jgi:hypothetical protein